LLSLSGCSSDTNRSSTIKTTRADSLMNVINQARSSAEKKTSILSQGKIDSLATLSDEELSAQIGMVKEPSNAPSPGAPKTGISVDQKAKPDTGTTAYILTDKDTAGSVEKAISKNAAMVMVDSGSAEDLRLDSLMAIADNLSAGYRAYVLTHTHKNLAQQAHQDPAKQRRLLLAINAAKDRREQALVKANEARKKRLEAHLKTADQTITIDTVQ